MTYSDYARMILDSLAANAERRHSITVGSLSRTVETACSCLASAYDVEIDRQAMQAAFSELLPQYPQLALSDIN